MSAIRTLLLVLAGLLPCTSSKASTVAIELVTSRTNYFGPYMAGWSFELLNPTRIDALGTFTTATLPLDDHVVGIWDQDGSGLLVEGVIPAGSSGDIVSSFRFVTVSPKVLLPGAYVIGVFGGNSLSIQDAAWIVTAPGVMFLENRTSDGAVPGLEFPSLTVPPNGDGFFGPNFRFTIVPEPQSWIIGLALAGFSPRRLIEHSKRFSPK
jgi:hypothetical protein